METRRTMLKSMTAGALGALVAPAFAHTDLNSGMKMMPVDTRNVRGGWELPARNYVQVKDVKIGQGLPKTIASTTAKTPEAFLEQISYYATLPGLDCVDIRPDYLPVMSGKAFADLMQEGYKRAGHLGVEVSLRDKLEGGGRQYSDAEADKFWTDYLTNGGQADFCDFEMFRDIKSIRKLVGIAHERGMKVMLSDHEFGWTPSEDDMLRRLLFLEKEGSDILKMAVWANNMEDCLRLMSVTWKYHNYYGTHPLCTMAMGPIGCLSRVTGQFTGNDLTFVIAGKSGSAPGQFPLNDVLAMMKMFQSTMQSKAAQTRTDK